MCARHIVLWHCIAMLLIVHAFVDEILDQIIVLNMTEADVLMQPFFMRVAIFSFCELNR